MKIAGIVVGIIGLLFLGLAGYLFVQEQLFLQRAEPTTAVVMSNKRYTYTGQVNENGVQHYYCSEFQFKSQDGRGFTFEEPDCAQLDSPPDYKVGQRVPVYYDPQDPGNTVQMRNSEYSNTLAAAGSGALVVLLGLVLYWIDLLRRMRPAGSAAR